MLEDCDLHTILDMPQGTFQGAGVKTVVLFFEKGRPTRRSWYCQLDPGRSLGKTNPLNEADLAEFVQLARTKGESANSWSVDVGAVNTETYDLSVKNPNRAEEASCANRRRSWRRCGSWMSGRRTYLPLLRV